MECHAPPVHLSRVADTQEDDHGDPDRDGPHWRYTRHQFNPDDVQALAKAEERFKKLTGRGFTAAVRTASGEVSKVQSFDPNAEETVFFPRLVGG